MLGSPSSGPSSGLPFGLGTVVIGYVVILFVVAWWSKAKVHDHEDFLVAGRRLSVWLAWPTLTATWFGAGALLTATDEVRRGGLRMAALDPFGAGLCLLLAGWLLAAPLWSMKLLTLSDFFRIRFGPRAERWSAILMVPSYFGWIAAQFVALAGILDIIFGLPMSIGITVVAVVGTAYALVGGMWSVTLTDAIQMVLIAVGLFILADATLSTLGDGSVALGFHRLLRDSTPDKLQVIPSDELSQTVGWLGVLAVGALGNLPGQDLVQRIFASRSARAATWACHLSGLTYLTIGLVPLVLGLAADLLVPSQQDESTLTILAGLYLDPLLGIVFVLVVMSAVISTIDSALLSPASVLAQNLGLYWFGDRITPLQLNRYAVLVVAIASLVTAYAGESAYGMLESAYELGMVSLLVPLVHGIRSPRGNERAALVSMGVGTSLWLTHRVVGASHFGGSALADSGLALPIAGTATLLGWLAYELTAAAEARRSPDRPAPPR